MELTKETPKEEGYYWFCDHTEHTPTIVRIIKDDINKKLYATNEEFVFYIGKKDKKSLWCKIPLPTINGILIEPDSLL